MERAENRVGFSLFKNIIAQFAIHYQPKGIMVHVIVEHVVFQIILALASWTCGGEEFSSHDIMSNIWYLRINTLPCFHCNLLATVSASELDVKRYRHVRSSFSYYNWLQISSVSAGRIVCATQKRSEFSCFMSHEPTTFVAINRVCQDRQVIYMEITDRIIGAANKFTEFPGSFYQFACFTPRATDALPFHKINWHLFTVFIIFKIQ